MGSFNSIKINYDNAPKVETNINSNTKLVSYNLDTNNIKSINQENNMMESVNLDNFETQTQTNNGTGDTNSSFSAKDTVLQELSEKTVVSTRPAEGDEAMLFSEITEYSDGTTRATGTNVNFVKGATDYITMPLDGGENGDGPNTRTITIIEGRDDHMVMQEQYLYSSFDESTGISAARQSMVISHYEGRDDHLVKEVRDVENNTVTYYYEENGQIYTKAG